ncbi:hypothetical protein GWK47_011256 [Chionoecetes opilio]|uniref:Uncharacterized protein n=1 Tax=Chionoecetes opilio TaxID=41210 RepID=A0A8J5CPX7_CHIOP|nr:hypothetical protein GWK47_011256 [Chionoecetes opilio]
MTLKSPLSVLSYFGCRSSSSRLLRRPQTLAPFGIPEGSRRPGPSRAGRVLLRWRLGAGASKRARGAAGRSLRCGEAHRCEERITWRQGTSLETIEHFLLPPARWQHAQRSYCLHLDTRHSQFTCTASVSPAPLRCTCRTVRHPTDMALTFLLWNARSLLRKSSELQTYLRDSLPSVVGLCKTWLPPHLALNLPGYSILRRDRQQGRGGGILLALRDVLHRSPLPFP